MSLKTLGQHEVHLWRRRVLAEPLDTACLNEAELAQGQRFVFPKDQQRYLTTRLMVREVLSRYEQVAHGDWEFAKNDYGKPEISAPLLFAPLFFSVSHTAKVIVVAVARVAEIGVDVESRIPGDFYSIAQKFFAAEENAWINGASDKTASGERFLTIWTLKEAYMKALGLGFSLPPTQFAIVPDEDFPGAELIVVPEVDSTKQGWYLQRMFWADWPAMAMAVSMDREPLVVLQS